MSEDIKEFYEKFKKDTGKMNKLIPQAAGGFGQMFVNIMQEGALSIKEKELIALGIGIGIQCEPCIKLHVKKSLEAGATKEEILEAVSVAIMMGGGPAYTHIPLVIDTLEALQS
jgi:AhpD family alkylhydroperoxidase